MFGSNQFETLENGFLVPVSSTRCGSGSAFPTAVYSQLHSSTKSPSGITPKLNPLAEGGVREISPCSPMDSSAASFPDKQLLGAQEQLSGSLATSTIVVDGNPNPQATILKHSGQDGKRKNSANVAAVIDTSMRTPLGSLSAHSKKRRKLLHELESLKSVQSESKSLHQKLEKKPSKMHIKLNTLMPGQVAGANFLLPDRVASQHYRPHKKSKASHKPEETLDQSHYLAKQTKRDELLNPNPFLAIKGGNVQACVDRIHDQEALLVFGQQIQGDFMKSLELDNEVDEQLFRTAIENPLSPALPEISCEIS